jgi:CRP/FNR family transcriptional regulator, dissimilatory nitrate respiration regulator
LHGNADALPAELRALLPGQPARPVRGSLPYPTGRRPTAMFHVGSGEVALQRGGEEGELLVLQRTRHGFVGEASLQAERDHCDAVVTADAWVTSIPRQALRLHLIRTEGNATALATPSGLKTLARSLGITHEALYRAAAALERQGRLLRGEGRLRLRAATASRGG